MARRLVAVALALLPLCAAGCFGVSANPFRLGNLPAGDIIRTHAKPAGRGYYRDHDPEAANLKVDHVGPNVNQVRSQHVLVASVCDKDGNGRRGRRVEWHVSGVGHLVEVDESGVFPGRGYLVDDKYAVTYTNSRQHVIDRGNDKPDDDFTIEPGQTWAVITSDVEGETHVTVHAPGIHNWDEHKKFVIKHWIDAQATFPPDATNPVGTIHDLVTQVSRRSDQSAANNYLVTYQIIDGPPAFLEAAGQPPGKTVTVPIDGQGRALARLRQATPTVGQNRVRIDVARPPIGPNGRQVNVAAETMTKTWVAPELKLEKFGPETVLAGEQIEYRVRVSNTGTVATSPITLRDTLPPTLQLIGTAPIVAPGPDGTLVWPMPPLQPGEFREVQIMCRATAPGTVTNVAEAVADNAPLKRGVVLTRVVAPRLVLTKVGSPKQANVGERVDFRIKISNAGDGPALRVQVQDVFDPGLVTLTGQPVAIPDIPRLEPGQSADIDVAFIAKSPGKLCNLVYAKADNFQQGAQASDCVTVRQPRLTVKKRPLRAEQPDRVFVGGEVQFEIIVENPAGEDSADAREVVLRDQLPIEMRFQRFIVYSANDTNVGSLLPGSFVVEWKLGTIKPGETRRVAFAAIATQASERPVCNRASATMAGGFTVQSSEYCFGVDGVPAYNLEILPDRNPVPAGEQVTFFVKVLNPGSLPVQINALQLDLRNVLSFVAGRSGAGREARLDGKTVKFGGPATVLPPGKAEIYEVRALTDVRQPGKTLVIATAEIQPLGAVGGQVQKLVQEQSLTIYDPNNAARLGNVNSQRPDTGAIAEAAPAPLPPPRKGLSLRLGPPPVLPSAAPRYSPSVLAPAVAASELAAPSYTPTAPPTRKLKLSVPPAPAIPSSSAKPTP